MSLAVLHSRALSGLEAPEVTVEVHLADGLPSFTIVGLPGTEVKESRDRVRAALVNPRSEFPARRITVNLAPAELPKESGRVALPLAPGMLAALLQLVELARARGSKRAGANDARARSRRCRRPQRADGRPSRNGKVDARGAFRGIAPADERRGSARICSARLARLGWLSPGNVETAPVPRSAPFGFNRRAGRRGQRPAPRRNIAGAQWRAVSGRAAGIRPQGARSPARTARIRPGRDFARRAPGRVSGAFPTDRCDEPLPLRVSGTFQRQMPLHARPGDALPSQAFRAAPRSHRHPD